MADYVTIAAPRLHEIVAAICRAAGSEAREARLVADHLVLSNLSGHDSHGVGMLPHYLGHLPDRLTLNAHAKIAVDSGALIVVDGGLGYGQVVAFEAMEMGIERARRHGVCVVALRNAHHIGRIGHWGEQCAAAGLISTHYVNVVGHHPLVAPFGGSDARFATNPYCCAIPVPGGEPLVLDFATSKVAMGKVRVARNKGEPAPEGSLIDAQGYPTRNPEVMYQEPRGALLPIGDHKGSGLALICEMLAGAVSGGGALHLANTKADTIVNNMLSVIFDAGRLGGIEAFAREARACLEWVRQSPPAPGVERVLVAGEPERAMRARRGAEGVPVDATTWGEILAAGRKAGASEQELKP